MVLAISLKKLVSLDEIRKAAPGAKILYQSHVTPYPYPVAVIGSFEKVSEFTLWKPGITYDLILDDYFICKDDYKNYEDMSAEELEGRLKEIKNPANRGEYEGMLFPLQRAAVEAGHDVVRVYQILEGSN